MIDALLRKDSIVLRMAFFTPITVFVFFFLFFFLAQHSIETVWLLHTVEKGEKRIPY